MFHACAIDLTLEQRASFMMILSRAGSCLLRIAKLAAVLGGLAFVVAMILKEEVIPAEEYPIRVAQATLAGNDGHRVLVTKEGAGAEAFQKVVLQGRDDDERMTLLLYPDDSVHFNVGAGTPIRLNGFTRANGVVGLAARNRKGEYRFWAAEDGSSEVEILNLDGRVLHRFRVSPTGGLVGEAPVIR